MDVNELSTATLSERAPGFANYLTARAIRRAVEEECDAAVANPGLPVSALTIALEALTRSLAEELGEAGNVRRAVELAGKRQGG